MNLNFDALPFTSRRSPVVAGNGIVATSQPLASQAGVAILQRGGNAVDAAIATAAALTVLEPTSNGIGSDAFAILWDGGQLSGINASGRWPKAALAERVLAQGYSSMPENGWHSVSVPGCVRMWSDLHERYGALEFSALLEPAIRYAEQGYPVSPVVAALWQRTHRKFSAISDEAIARDIAGWFEIFTINGQAPDAGQHFHSPSMARTLKLIAEQGADVFYQGEIAEEMVRYAKASGGLLSAEDLASHKNQWVDPISMRYGDIDVWELPPNGQGIAALIALGILDGTDVHDQAVMDPRAWHLEIEAIKLAFADTYRYIADPEHARVPTQGLLDKGYLGTRRRLITDRAQPCEPGEPDFGTVYLCTADRDGMMVSFIQSNYKGFGSGVVVPSMGISFQDRATGFSLQPGHPNEAAPGKRPRHTIIPAFLTRNGAPIGPFGVMGGEMQPQGHLQVVRSLVDHGLNPQAVLDRPRWRWERDVEVHVEPGLDPSMASALSAMGHRIVSDADSLAFGRGQMILRLDSGAYVAGSEPRADGAAVGY